MERLIHSSSVPSKPHLLPSAHLSQFGRLERRNFGFLLPRAVAAKTTTYREHVRVKLFSSERLRRPTCCLSKPTDDPILGSPPLPSACGPPGSRSSPGSQPVGQKSDAGSISQKVLATGKIILLSVLVMIAINPILTTSPALATFQAATQATAGGGKGLFTSEILSSAWTGFFAGCLHTLSGPDHLAALAPLSIGRTRLESAAVGALWGCGHDAGQVIFGLLFLLLKDRLHIEVIRTWGTRVVGLTLLVIGGMGIKEASESVPTPCVALENGECDVSVYESLEKENPVAKKKKKIGFATFATGIVHGLQPDALMMVLPALALPSRVAGAAFLSMFLAGTVVAMGGYTVFIGSCSEALKERVPRITEKLTWASSLVAIGLGFAILVSQFFGFSLY